MKRLSLIIATACAVAAPLLVTTDALAQRQREGRGPQREMRQPERRVQSERYDRYDRRDTNPGRRPDRGYEDDRRWSGGPPPRVMAPRQMEPAYTPYGGPGRGQAMRRGGYLAPEAGTPIYDYGRFRLRPPPPGYAWYRVGDEYFLTSRGNGLIFDVIRP